MKSLVYYIPQFNDLIVATPVYVMDQQDDIQCGPISLCIDVFTYSPIGYLLDMGNRPFYVEKLMDGMDYVGTL